MKLIDKYRPLGITRERPLILLADQPWDSPGGGAVILRSLLGGSVGEGIVWVTPARSERNLKAGYYGLAAGSLGRSGRFSVLFDLLYCSRDLAQEVVALSDKLQASGIWAVLHGATVAIAARLVESGGHRLHVSVHDDPVYATALRSRRLALFTPIIARHFRTALCGARSIDVVSPGMGDRYRRKFGIQFSILHRGLAERPAPAPPYDVKANGISVGVLGNTYAYRQLPVLARAIELAARRMGVPGRVVVCGDGFGEQLARDMRGRIEVEATGHLSEPEAIERLRHCGALYLNYPFGRMGKVLRETSFPTKLTTYIYASRPILVHAPAATSVSELPAEHGYTVPWSSLNPVDGATRLIEMVTSPRFAGSYHDAAETIRARHYDLNTHRATLDGILARLLAVSGSQAAVLAGNKG